MSEVIQTFVAGAVATNSTVNIVPASVTRTIVTTANFLVLATYEINNDQISDQAVTEFFCDGLSIGFDEYEARSTTAWMPKCVATFMNLGAGSRTLELRLRVTAGGLTAAVRNIRLFAWSPGTMAAAADRTLHFADPPAFPSYTLGITPFAQVGGLYLGMWGTSVEAGASSNPRIATAIYLDGVPIADIGSTEVACKLANQRCLVGGMRVIAVNAGTLTAQMTLTSAGVGNVFSHDSSIILIPLSAATATLAGYTEAIADVAFTNTAPISVVSTTFTPNGGFYLMLASTQLRSAGGTTNESKYVLRHNAIIQQGQGQIRHRFPAQRLSFFAFAYQAYGVATMADSLEIGVTSGTTTAHNSALAVLQIGLQDNQADPVTIQEQIEQSMNKILADGISFADDFQLLKALDNAITSETISLTDLMELLQTKQLADAPTLAESLLAIILPGAVVQGFYGPVQLVELLMASGTRRYAGTDLYVPANVNGYWPDDTLFKGLQLQTTSIGEGDIDQVLGFQAFEDATFTFGNLTGEFSYLRDEECRGALIRSFAWDPIRNEMRTTFVGVIRNVSVGFQCTVNATVKPIAFFEKDFPLRKITTTEFPKAHPDAVDQPITVCLGSWRKLPCRLIEQNPTIVDPLETTTGTWTYLVYEKAFGKDALGFALDITLPIVRTVYRDGRVVATTEYTVVTTGGNFGEKYVTLVFPYPQDAAICCDVEQIDTPLLSAPVVLAALFALYGGEKVDLNSWGHAQGKLEAAYVTGDDTQQPRFHLAAFEFEKVQTIIDRLIFRIRIGRNGDGEWTFTAILPAAEAALQLGYGDSHFENIVELGPLEQRSGEEMPSSFVFEYGYSSGFQNDQQGYLYKRSYPGASLPGSQERPLSNKYIRDNYSADAVLQYTARRWLTTDRQLALALGMEARALARDDLVLVDVPLAAYGLVSEPFLVGTLTRELARISPRLLRYDPEIFAFRRNPDADPKDPLEPLNVAIPDYRYTPPPPPVLLKLAPGATTATPLSTNVGNGTITIENTDAHATPGFYRLRIVTAVPNGGVYAITDELGHEVPVFGGIVGFISAIGAGVALTVNDGTIDFVVGDGFDLRVNSAWSAHVATGAGGDGRTVVDAQVYAQLPAGPINGTSVIFKWRPQGEPLIANYGGETPISPSDWGNLQGVYCSIPGLTPGVRYDLYAYIHNSKNFLEGTTNLQDGPTTLQNNPLLGQQPPSLLNVLVPTVALTAPDVTDWTIVGISLVAAILLCPKPPGGPAAAVPAGVRGVRYYRRGDDQSPTDQDFLFEAGLTPFTDATTGSNPSKPWRYWMRLVGQNGVLSDLSPKMTQHVRQSTPYEVGPGGGSRIFRADHLADVETLNPTIWTDIGQLGAEMPTQQELGAGQQPVLADLRVDVLIRCRLGGSPSASDTITIQIFGQQGANQFQILFPQIIVDGFVAPTGTMVIPVSGYFLIGSAGSTSESMTVQVQVLADGGADFFAGDTTIINTLIFRGA